MTTAVLSFPSQAKVTTNTRLQVCELPLGVRVPATYTITAATAGAAQTVVTSAAAATGAITLSVTALSAALGAFSILTLGTGGAVVTSAAAASTATSITVFPINFDIASGTSFSFNTGALTANSTMLPVAALPVIVDVGTLLTFGAQVLTVTGRSPAGAVQLRVSPIVTTLTAGATASTKGLLTVVGCTSSPIPSPEPKTVDTTNLNSGIGQEMVITAIKQTMTVNFNVIAGDLGGGLLVQILRNKAKYNKEIYFEVTLSDGELHTGAAIITAGPESGEVQDLRKIACTLMVQGQSYTYTESTYAFY